MKWGRLCDDSQRSTRRFKRSPVIVRLGRGVRIEQHGDTGNAGRDILEQLHPLTPQRGLHIDEARHISAWMRQALDKARAHRVGNNGEHHRYNSRFP